MSGLPLAVVVVVLQVGRMAGRARVEGEPALAHRLQLAQMPGEHQVLLNVPLGVLEGKKRMIFFLRNNYEKGRCVTTFIKWGEREGGMR